MTIAAILSHKGGEVISITLDRTVGEAVPILAERRIGAVPVLNGSRIVGVFSERDVIRAIEEHGAAALTRGVGDAMTAPVITVEPGDAVIAALSLMTQRRIRHLPVLHEGALVGLVSIGDLVKYRIDRIEADAEAMRSYIQSA